MRLRAAVASDRGLIRPANEDSFFLRRGLYAVCDGMGGARAGEVASQMACLGLLALDPASASKKDLRTAIRNTNQAIISRSLAEDHLLGMGTTLTAVLVKEGSLILAHVGDSRAYLFRNGSLSQLTDDHSWVGEMVRRGELTPAQAAVHPHRSVITRALGTDGDLEPDLTEIDISEGDRILLCSDGLSGFVSEAELTGVLQRDETPQAIAELLIKAALDSGGEDNVTVVVVEVMPETGQHDDGSVSGDQVGDGILVGPTDRGALTPSALSRSKKASAAVRERLSRRTAPSLRPVGSRPVGESVGDSPAAEQPLASEPEPAREATPAADVTPAGGGQPRKRWRRRRWLFVALAIGIIVIAVAGFAVFNSTVYYVGAYEDTVALYRGLPGSFLGIELSSVIQLGTVDYQTLAPGLRTQVDAHDLGSKEEGRAFLDALDEQQ